MMRLWKWYQNGLFYHPVKTQVISSGLLWGVGDIAAQYVTHSTARKRLQISCVLMMSSFFYGEIHAHLRSLLSSTLLLISALHPYKGYLDSNCKLLASSFALLRDANVDFRINWKRVAITSMFGFGFVGPVGHFWYEGLDKFIRLKLQLQPKSVRFVSTKVAADGIIFGPLDLLVFFTYMGFSTGKSVEQVKEDVKRDFIPALVLEGGVWPVVQIVNFRYVPVRYQLLYVNIFCLLDSAFLSWIEQQKDAPWKQWFTPFNSLKEPGGQGEL